MLVIVDNEVNVNVVVDEYVNGSAICTPLGNLVLNPHISRGGAARVAKGNRPGQCATGQHHIGGLCGLATNTSA